MKIIDISPDEFPGGTGTRFKSTQAYFDIMEKIGNMKPGTQFMASGLGKFKTSASSAANVIRKELSRRHQNGKFEITTQPDELGFRNLYVKRHH